MCGFRPSRDTTASTRQVFLRKSEPSCFPKLIFAEFDVMILKRTLLSAHGAATSSMNAHQSHVKRDKNHVSTTKRVLFLRTVVLEAPQHWTSHFLESHIYSTFVSFDDHNVGPVPKTTKTWFMGQAFRRTPS